MDAQAAESLLSWAEDARTKLTGLHAKPVFAEISAQYDALKSGLQWFIHNGQADRARRLVTSLVPFWMATKRLDEGIASVDAVLSDRSSSLQNEALELGRKRSDPTLTALALAGLARLALRTDVSQARELCREAIAVTDGTSDRLGRSNAMHVPENLSMVERQLGNLERAEALGRRALDIDVKRGDQMAIAWKVNALAAVAAVRGQFVRAATLIGIADATMLAAGGAWPPDEKQQYEGTVAALISGLGIAAVERARGAGSSMSTPAAIAFALGSADIG